MLFTILSFSSDFRTLLQKRVGWLKLSSSEELYLKPRCFLGFLDFCGKKCSENNINFCVNLWWTEEAFSSFWTSDLKTIMVIHKVQSGSPLSADSLNTIVWEYLSSEVHYICSELIIFKIVSCPYSILGKWRELFWQHKRYKCK